MASDGRSMASSGRSARGLPLSSAVRLASPDCSNNKIGA
jgi:hypothetical protein